MRLAVYVVPDENHPIYLEGSKIIGYDVREECVLESPDKEMAPFIGDAHGYGIHGTVKGIFTPTKLDDVIHELETVAASSQSFSLKESKIGGFGHSVLFVKFERSPKLRKLHKKVLNSINKVRIRQIEPEYKQSYPGRSYGSRKLNELIEKYGEPYVLEKFNFHITLASSVPNATIWRKMKKALEAKPGHGEHLTGKDMLINSIYLFSEGEDGEDRYWTILKEFPFADAKNQ